MGGEDPTDRGGMHQDRCGLVKGELACVPKVMPLGHRISEATRTCRSTPFIPDFSILAGSPQSDQYRNLRDKDRGTILRGWQTGLEAAAHAPRERIHGNGRWLFQAPVKQNLDLGAVEVGRGNRFGAKVRPVQVFIDPVHSDAHRRLDMIYHFAVRAHVSSLVQHSAGRHKISGNVNTRPKTRTCARLRSGGEPENSLLAQVGPEEHLLVKVCVQGHCVPLLFYQLRVLLPLQAEAANVTPVGKDQAGFLPWKDGFRRIGGLAKSIDSKSQEAAENWQR